jgi:hypothetical protein
LFESNVNYRFEPVIQSDISIVGLASGRDLPGQFALSWAPSIKSINIERRAAAGIRRAVLRANVANNDFRISLSDWSPFRRSDADSP